MKKTIYILTLSLISFKSFSQSYFKDGFIVTNNLDTIFGHINQKNTKDNSIKCIFKSKDQSIKEYDANSISSYGIGKEKLFVSKTLKHDGANFNLFFECLVQGKVDLYYLRQEPYTGYYIYSNELGLKKLTNPTKHYKDQNGNIIEQVSHEYRKQLRHYLFDCKSVYSNIDYTILSHRSLKELLLKYNQTISINDKNYLFFYNSQKAVNIRFGVTVGINLYSLKLDSYYWNGMKINSQLGYNLGVNMNLNWAKINEKFNLVIGLGLENQDYTGKKLDSNANSWDTETKADFSNILLNSKIILKYKYPKGKITPSVKIGINLNNELYSKSKVIEKNLIDGNISSVNYFNYYPLPKSFIGYYAGIGFEYNLSNKQIVLFELNYCLSNFYFSDTDSGYFDNEINGQISNFSATIGLIF